MAAEKYISDDKRKAVFGRSTRFCIVQHDALAMVNNRSNDEVVKTQQLVTDDLLGSLEEFVKAARAGRLEGAAALGLACAEW